MGCDISSYAELRRDGVWRWAPHITPAFDPDDPLDVPEEGEVFHWRHYGLFAFLAGVRNMSRIEPLAAPRDLPGDVSPELRKKHEAAADEAFDTSWFTLEELLAHDYEQIIWDRRLGNGITTSDPEEGERLSLREFLGAGYFSRLAALAELGPPADVRVVFWFDS